MTPNLWTHLHWLTVLEEQQSFTRAAERLEVSKSAVSLKIKELEELAGVALVQRTTRNVRLTDAAKELVRELKQPFANIEQSFRTIRDSDGPVSGVVRVTAPVAFSRQHLVPKISEFLKLYPEIRVQLVATDQIVSLASDGFDLAIRHSDSIPETAVASVLCNTRSLLVASPNYLSKRGIPLTPRQLEEHHCIYYPRGTQEPVWTFNHDSHASESVQVLGIFAANNSEVMRDAAINHLGIAMLPDFSVQQAINQGLLFEVLPDWHIQNEFADTISIVRPYAEKVPRPVLELYRWLKNKFSEH
ncbi:LysR family transcriptional regulator [Reinekea thalattae]|uniref:LysR family transcriptional regulator n=1 Tax=Reinekea thalattae TaxID=2593301 RepID=A0A5C8ZCJ9_9GAMM|nr:LysR family transcriptional regulator [Reinekea thalattae]TXR54868.1 LysR family transcriptional regulator [Reinekea thalattae]